MSELPDGEACPPWCTSRHGAQAGEEDLVHLGGALRIRSTLLRLCVSTDPRTGVVDGPYVLLVPGGRRDEAIEYTLHEAEALLDALTQLVEQGASAPSAARPGTEAVSRPAAP